MSCSSFLPLIKHLIQKSIYCLDRKIFRHYNFKDIYIIGRAIRKKRKKNYCNYKLVKKICLILQAQLGCINIIFVDSVYVNLLFCSLYLPFSFFLGFRSRRLPAPNALKYSRFVNKLLVMFLE